MKLWLGFSTNHRLHCLKMIWMDQKLSIDKFIDWSDKTFIVRWYETKRVVKNVYHVRWWWKYPLNNYSVIVMSYKKTCRHTYEDMWDNQPSDMLHNRSLLFFGAFLFLWCFCLLCCDAMMMMIMKEKCERNEFCIQKQNWIQDWIHMNMNNANEFR